jgi:hypothetical protein
MTPNDAMQLTAPGCRPAATDPQSLPAPGAPALRGSRSCSREASQCPVVSVGLSTLTALVVMAVCLCGAGFAFGADAKANNAAAAAAAVEGMFPGRVSPYLTLFNEPALGTRIDGLRITRLQPGALLCMRIWWPPPAPYKPPQKPVVADPRVTVKQGGFNHPDPKGAELPVRPEEVRRLLDTFLAEELFNLSTRDETGVKGGANDADYDRYRVVAREALRTGPVKRCADAVLELLQRVQPRE